MLFHASAEKDIGGKEVEQRHLAMWRVAMWKKLMQATAITSALYLVMGMSKPPADRLAIQSQILENSQQSFNAFNKRP